ncbi:MAG: GLPGLI family protein [Xanthomarina sp.]
MKKYFYGVFVLLLYLNSTNTVAQNNQNSGSITYSVSLDPFYNSLVKRYKEESNKSALHIFKDMAKTASLLECKLSYNRFQSKFELENAMGLGGMDKTMFLAVRSVSKGDYYTDLATQKQILKDNSSKELYIESKLETINWELTNDIKQICGYICYKALAYEDFENIGKVVITVWYTPQIPVAFGPKEHVGNLPGLVLEYKDQMVHFIAKKVVLNPKKTITIEWPKGKVITKEDFENQNDFSFSTIKENSRR